MVAMDKTHSSQLPLEPQVETLAAIIAPITGRFLANVAAERLYAQLARIDQQAIDDLLIRLAEAEEA